MKGRYIMGAEYQNTEYESKLKEISFYKLHPEYIAFVGDKFEKYRILQVGESHFIPQLKEEQDIFPIDYFEKWLSDSCEDMKSFKNNNSDDCNWRYSIITQKVIVDYLNGYRTRSHGIFTELVKVFSKIYEKRDIGKINTEKSQNYRHFAFMNFFQMPSLYKGEKFWNSLKYSASKNADRLNLKNKEETTSYANKVWDKIVKESTAVFDETVDILNPEIIIFTSKSAWDAYKGKYKNAPNIINTVHPGCPWWHKPGGKEKLIEKWTAICNE